MRFAPDRPLRLAPATVLDYRELARRRLPRQLFDYVDGGAYDEATLRANVADLGGVLLRQGVVGGGAMREQAREGVGPKPPPPPLVGPGGPGGGFARPGRGGGP